MITVCIAINGHPILARSAVNRATVQAKRGELKGQWCAYKVDDGRVLRHRREDGAIKLAIAMLEGVKQL